MEAIKKIEVTPLDYNVGKIIDSASSTDDKTKNTYSMRIIDEQLGEKSDITDTYSKDDLIPSNPLSNTRLGDNALTKFELETGTDNGTNNTAIGNEALSDNTTGYRNTAVGSYALDKNTIGHRNTGVGYYSLKNNTEGIRNTALGSFTLQGNTTGGGNTAIGTASLYTNTTGYNNIAVGDSALYTNTTGYKNTGVGYYSLHYNTTGVENVAVGSYSLHYNTTGEKNVSIGDYSLYRNTTGLQNTAIGYNAGQNNTTYNNITCIGYNSQVTGDNQVQLGNDSTSVYAYSTLNVRSDKRDKKDIKDIDLGLDFIKKLRPVKYKWKFRNEGYEGNRYHEGLIAQEVKEVMDELKVDFGGYQDHSVNGGEDVLTLGYGEFIAPLIKAIQEQQKMIEDLNKKVEKLSSKK